MTEEGNQLLPLSRRKVIKAGAFLALSSSLHLAALPQALESKPKAAASGRLSDGVQPAAPPWMSDLIIYEVATKGFTSPNGPESGTFNSLRSKLEYLQELGVTGLWLTGYSLCDPHHFYNIWTQYAVIEPDKFDPTLGTREEFKELIDEAHQRGIKVFLDVITHGLMSGSPVIEAHPSWFRGASWGMKDFDWNGGHTDLDEWWVKIYTDFITVYGVDGYRLDVNIFRPDLWERIRQTAAKADHPIVIWEEQNAVIPGVTDFTQRENWLSIHETGVLNEVLVNDLPGFYDRKFGRSGYYQVQVDYRDGSSLKGSTKGEGPLGVHLMGLSADRVGRRSREEGAKPDGLPDVRITLKNVSRKTIADIIVRNDMEDEWRLGPAKDDSRPLAMDAPEPVGRPGTSQTLDIYIATIGWGSSLQLSCHDNGWTGFPLNKNPYVAQGSRSLFGYSFLFSPMIPIFFAGEEFDATFHPLPALSPHLYGDKDAGKGRWLYGSMLDWNELKVPEHRDMLFDVRKMIAIRRKYSRLLAMWPGSEIPNLKAVSHDGNISVPVPYLRWDDRSAILIVANRNRDREAHLKLQLAINDGWLGGHNGYLVTDLWSTAEARKYTAAELGDFRCTVQCDGKPGGGLRVFKIESAD